MKHSVLNRIRAAQNLCFACQGARKMSEQDLSILGLPKDVAIRLCNQHQR